MISIDKLHIEKCDYPSLCTVLPIKIPVMCLQGFHVPISLIPLQVMTQIPTG